MDSISTDEILLLCSFLDIKSIIQFLSTSTCLNSLKLKIQINTLVCNSKIKDLCYYDNFLNICADRTYQFPKHVKHIAFNEELDTRDKFITKKIIIPDTVTSLTFYYPGYLNRLVIPKSVTHLYFTGSYGGTYKTELKPIDSIDKVVRDPDAKHKCYKCGTYKLLDFIECGNIVRERVPDGIIHLTSGNNFIQPIYDCVPKSVTHLSVSRNYFLLSLPTTLPSSVIHLTVRFEAEFSDDQIIKPVKIIHKFIQKLEIQLPNQRRIYYANKIINNIQSSLNVIIIMIK